MLIIMQMYSKRKRIHTKNCVFYIYFQCSKGESTFLKKKIKTSDMLRPEYIQWQNVASVEFKLFITLIMITLFLQGVDKM